MYIEINFYRFVDSFIDHDRKENFSYDALQLLFDYFEDYEDSTGEKIEFDCISICCEYTEATIEEFNQNYSTEFDTLEEIQEYVEDQSMVVGLTDTTIVYVAF